LKRCKMLTNSENIPVTLDCAPDDALVWYDGPCIFTVEGNDGCLYLVFSVDMFDDPEDIADENAIRARWLVVPITDDVVAELVACRLPVRSALVGNMFVVDTDSWSRVRSVTPICATDVPEDWLPDHDATLYVEST